MEKRRLLLVGLLFIGIMMAGNSALGNIDIEYKIDQIPQGLVFEMPNVKASPQHMVMDNASGNIFVSFDAGETGGQLGVADFVLELNPDLVPQKKWGNLGISGIRDIAVDDSGWIYVTDVDQNCVKKINRNTNQVVDFINNLKDFPLAVGWNRKNNTVVVGTGENLNVYNNSGILIGTKAFNKRIHDLVFFPSGSSGVHFVLLPGEVVRIDAEGKMQSAPFEKALKTYTLTGYGLGTDYKGGVWMGAYNQFGRFYTSGVYGSPAIFKYEKTYNTNLFSDKNLGPIGDVMGPKSGVPYQLYIATNNAIYKVKLF